jgi:hypothetical protein
MTYNIGLEASKLLAEVLEVETEKRWKKMGDRYYLAYKCQGYPKKDEYPSPDLSELSEVFRMLGDKKGWYYCRFHSFNGSEADTEMCQDCSHDNWYKKYMEICSLWATTQSQEKCDEFFINLIQK